jgi:hypothetical protein
MPLQNACFISFRHGEQELTQRFVSEFHSGISGELETQLGRSAGVFLDEERLTGGDLFNEAIAEHLCTSSCLIVIYTPSYFDLSHTYCAREYKAMVELERRRLALLGQGLDRTHGLIIPVIFRGEKILPAELREHRQYYDFADFLLTGRKLHKHSRYAGAIREMGEYIAERHRALAATVNEDCAGFRLPADGDIRQWLEGIVPGPRPLPGRADE